MARYRSMDPLHTPVLLVVAIVISLVACGGETVRETDASGGGGGGSGAGASGAGTCSAAGVPQDCDPIGLTGCAAGVCYVVKNQGSACVCPSGGISTGGSCNTSVECAPGHVCAGTRAPGVCRKTCLPSAPACGTGQKCTFITALPSFGYCEPK